VKTIALFLFQTIRTIVVLFFAQLFLTYSAGMTAASETGLRTVIESRPVSIRNLDFASLKSKQDFRKAREVIEHYIGVSGKVSLKTVDGAMLLHTLALAEGDYQESFKSLEIAIEYLNSIPESSNADRILLATWAAENYHSDKDYEMAEQWASTAWQIAIENAAFTKDAITSAEILYVALWQLGRGAEGIYILTQAIQLGPKDPSDQAHLYQKLAAALNQAGRVEDAMVALEKAKALFEKVTAENSPIGEVNYLVSRAVLEENFAILLQTKGKFSEARSHFQLALHFQRMTDERIKTLKPEIGVFIPEQSTGNLSTMLNFAVSQGALGNTKEEHRILSEILNHELIEAPLNAYTQVIAELNLATIFMNEGNAHEARAHYMRAIEIAKMKFPQESPARFAAERAQGRFHIKQGNWKEAREHLSWSTNFAIARFQDGGQLSDDNNIRAFRERSSVLSDLAFVLKRLGEDNIHEAFTLIQQKHMSETVRSVLESMARHLERGETSNSLRKGQDKNQLMRSQLEQAVRNVLNDNTAKNSAHNKQAKGNLRRQVETLRELRAGSLRAAKVYSNRAIPIARVQELLGSDEVLVFFDIGSTEGANSVLRWTIHGDQQSKPEWKEIELSAVELELRVSKLRCGLDKSMWSGELQRRKCLALGVKAPSNPDRGELDYSLVDAWEMFKLLFGDEFLKLSEKKLIVVANGTLTSFPLQALLTQQAKDEVKRDYRTLSWFGTTHSIFVLPSLQALEATKQRKKFSKGDLDYLGVANPDGLKDCDFQQEEIVETIDGLEKRARVSDNSEAGPYLLPTGYYTRQGVRSLCALPQTEQEVKEISGLFSSKKSHVLVGPKARVAGLKRLNRRGQLKRYRIVHFSTHGVVPGELALPGMRASSFALVLTPPTEEKNPLDSDDGLLTSSDISLLQLDADLVVLSACNSGFSAVNNADAFSTLVDSFIFAGTRSLLVTHWSVETETSKEFIVDTFKEAQDGSSDDALRSATRNYLGKSNAFKSHPSYWAAFSVVGTRFSLQ
jgi:CHAT domain-containing protein